MRDLQRCFPSTKTVDAVHKVALSAFAIHSPGSLTEVVVGSESLKSSGDTCLFGHVVHVQVAEKRCQRITAACALS